ncbi:MAG: DUF2911 domain-containing protein [Cyclobacteriaceae bacterium]|nr:DUF2911 domain-containing protein [Cyclobacteriaceae bacterium]
MLTTKSHSPFAEAKANFKGTEIDVAYCQPYKKGRVIFGEESDGALQPYGKYWRLGANEATQITFSSDVVFAGDQVKEGTYRMYAVPGKDQWEVSLNSELGKWGAFEPNYSLDVVKVKVPAQKTEDTAEQFVITFDTDSIGTLMNFVWDRTKVSVPITK